jgi:branched-chain amino acid transport system permease protein
MGNSGIVSFGHVSFMAIGAYTSALLTAQPSVKQALIKGLAPFLAHAHWATIPAALLGGVIAASFAGIIGFPLMRLAGLAAGIATLALLVIVNTVTSQWTSLTGGTYSFAGIASDTTLWGSLLWAIVVMAITYAFKQSRVGLRLQATREDEVAAGSVGINVASERWIAFMLGALIVGVAGALDAHYLGAINPGLFYFQITFLTIVMLVVGGVKSFSGAVIGTVVISVVTELLRTIEKGPHVFGGKIPELRDLTEVGLAVILLIVVTLRPRGITGGREIAWPFSRWAEVGRDASEVDTPPPPVRKAAGSPNLNRATQLEER